MGDMNCSNKNSTGIIDTSPLKITKHVKCRGETYPRDDIKRFPVPDDKVSWSVPFPEYDPVDHTSASVLKQPIWADIDVRNTDTNEVKWNQTDGMVERKSHECRYEVVDGVPRNPIGRTGMCGRGCLGRWGPNHAADPIVTRWKRDARGKHILDKKTGQQILQFVAIQRRDSLAWAIPGGMIDPGEQVSVTLKREFSEEALNSMEATAEKKKAIEKDLVHLFSKGKEIYRGYVDDPRNTDNSWMETVAYNFHDDSGTSVGCFALNAGDDAVGVRWTDIHSRLNLYASHAQFIEEVAKRHGAFW